MQHTNNCHMRLDEQNSVQTAVVLGVVCDFCMIVSVLFACLIRKWATYEHNDPTQPFHPQ